MICYRTNALFFSWRRPGWLALLLAMSLLSTDGLASGEDLSQMARDVALHVVPITKDQVDQARGNLVNRAYDLEQFLIPGSTNSENWKRYLKWGELQTELAKEETPRLKVLATVYQQLNQDERGLELGPFRQTSDALRHYLDLASAARLKNFEQVYARQLEALAVELEKYAERPTSMLEFSIGQRLDFITGLGQAPRLVEAVRRRYARPNVLLDFSTSFLSAALSEPIQETSPVRDHILGTSIRGTAYTTGTLSVKTLPSVDRAVLELTSQGHITSRNVGNNGPAIIRNTGQTDYRATKRVEITDASFWVYPADARATTQTKIHSINKRGGGLGSRLVSKMGWKKAGQTMGRANGIASRHAEDRIRDKFNEEAIGPIRTARHHYRDEFRYPLFRRGEFPPQIRYSSTSDSLSVELVQANRGQLGAPDSPPPLLGRQDLVVRLHETGANNGVAMLLGGTTASVTEPGQETQLDAKLPDWLENLRKQHRDSPPAATQTSTPKGHQEGPALLAQGVAPSGEKTFKPWSITLRQIRPVSIAFAQGQVRLTMHLARLTSGKETFQQWDVTAIYASPVYQNGGLLLHREGDLTVLPTSFDPEGKKRLASKQIALRSNLSKVLNDRSRAGEGFPETIDFPILEFTGGLAKVGTLELQEFTSEAGWLTVAWNRR